MRYSRSARGAPAARYLAYMLEEIGDHARRHDAEIRLPRLVVELGLALVARVLVLAEVEERGPPPRREPRARLVHQRRVGALSVWRERDEARRVEQAEQVRADLARLHDQRGD